MLLVVCLEEGLLPLSNDKCHPHLMMIFTTRYASETVYLAHILLLLVLVLQFFRAPADRQGTGAHTRGVIVGISIFAAVTIIGAMVMVVLGASNPDPNAVGVKTLEDWFPTVIILTGAILWLGTLIPALRGHAEASTQTLGVIWSMLAKRPVSL